ncbi:MAG: RnfABCDGE type electron transport complex subunit D, partial [Chitinispirillaceae bacterium]|nr:RnfABCDGE type electron transport complex subunit D [Chitinispirillaceae bacterium]
AGLSALFKLCSGGVLLVALFMATDPVTSPALRSNRFLYGAGCGVLTALFFLFGAQDLAPMHAVLIMSCMVPLFDRSRVPAPRGRTSDSIDMDTGS